MVRRKAVPKALTAALPSAAVYTKVKFASPSQNTKAKELVATDWPRRSARSLLSTVASTDVPARPAQPGRARRRLPLAWLGVVPFFAFTTAFLFLPAANVSSAPSRTTRRGDARPRAKALRRALPHRVQELGRGEPRHGRPRLVFGCSSPTPRSGGHARFIRGGLTTSSGVAANFAGIPLAAAFIATLGTIGVVTQFMTNQLGINPYDHGFSVFSKRGSRSSTSTSRSR